MGEVGDSAAGLAASANISVAGVAGAAGAALGGLVIGGPGVAWIGPVAAIPAIVALAAALMLRPRGQAKSGAKDRDTEVIDASIMSF